MNTWNAQQYVKNVSFISELGRSVISLLNPQPQEKILDLGCGEGTLAKKIQEQGAKVIGVDSSQDMVLAAKNKGIKALCMSGDKLTFDNEFDAIFSNAALHWMPDYAKVLNGAHRALTKNGRFVGEFGGAGNIISITQAIDKVYQNHPRFGDYQSPWYFPTDKEYAAQLERHGFKIISIKLIPRPTPITDIKSWLLTLANHAMQNLCDANKTIFLTEMENILKPKLYNEKQGWIADYVRLRFWADKI